MLCACVAAFGAEKIEGAFGKKLGDVFDPKKAIGLSRCEDGTPIYEFRPANSFRSFTRYYVLITPTSKKIYNIWGVGSAENTSVAQKEQAVIMEILQQKYGVKEKPGVIDILGDVNTIKQGNRGVVTKISGFGNVQFHIRYYDSDLVKLAESERITEESKKVNKSGL